MLACLRKLLHTVYQCARSCSPLGNIHKDNSDPSTQGWVSQLKKQDKDIQTEKKI